MSRNRHAEAVATVRVGDKVVRHPLTILSKSESTEGSLVAMRGTVIYIHPRGRFHVVRFDRGIRESFMGIMR